MSIGFSLPFILNSECGECDYEGELGYVVIGSRSWVCGENEGQTISIDNNEGQAKVYGTVKERKEVQQQEQLDLISRLLVQSRGMIAMVTSECLIPPRAGGREQYEMFFQ